VLWIEEPKSVNRHLTAWLNLAEGITSISTLVRDRQSGQRDIGRRRGARFEVLDILLLPSCSLLGLQCPFSINLVYKFFIPCSLPSCLHHRRSDVNGSSL